MLATQDPFEDAEKLQQQRGHWITAGVETRVFWPKRSQTLSFEGIQFLLQPAERGERGEILPAIALRTDGLGLTDLQCKAVIMRLATAIAWREGQKVELVMWGGGSSPFRLGMPRNNTISNYFPADNLCAPSSNEARKALAYYREGLSIDNPFYSFLGFYKAFSRSLPNGKERGPWITEKLPQLTNRAAIERRDELIQSGEDISTYVANQGRHAIAHAERDDIVDPDDPADHQRIIQDLPLIRHLAEIAMEDRLEVPRPDTYWKDHVYELAGFSKLFTEAGLEALRRGELAPDEKYECPEHYFVLARKQGKCFPLGKMRMLEGELFDRALVIILESESQDVRVRVTLDFVNERLIFDPLQDVFFNQARNSRASVLEEIECNKFLWCMFCNGQIEIWDETGEHQMAISQSCILTNVLPNHEAHQLHLEQLNALLAQFPPDESVI
ncbi:methylamine utilization protein MauJ [Aeromonas hydrophila]